MKVLIEPELRKSRHGFWVLDSIMAVEFADGRKLEIPSGFDTDFASSRVGRWNFLSVEAADSWATVPHDYFYRTASVSRLIADRYFREGLLADPDVAKYDAWKGFWGVRLFGWHAWNQHRRHEIIKP